MANNSIEQALLTLASTCRLILRTNSNSISGLVAEYIVAIDVTRVRFPADAFCFGLIETRCYRAAVKIQ